MALKGGVKFVAYAPNAFPRVNTTNHQTRLSPNRACFVAYGEAREFLAAFARVSADIHLLPFPYEAICSSNSALGASDKMVLQGSTQTQCLWYQCAG